MIRISLIATALLSGVSARAGDLIEGPVLADVIKVRDGDSIEVVAHVWPGTDVKVSVRIRGIDAPELRGKCPAEIELAERSREKLQRLVGNGQLELSRIGGGKYFGRVLADVITASGDDVGVEMLRSGHARPYRGEKRESWCEKIALIRQ